ncbi:MAG: transcriptional regulator, ArsR family [Pseudonocardiales bacterium]|nr:transcriptional regulator, ArsR family [Pseudonocardiales bacterium]
MKNNAGPGPTGRRLGPRIGMPAPALSATPAAILEQLREQPAPLTQAAIAHMTGLHPNTVREHLGNLIHRGHVVRFLTEPVGRGRPAWLYEASGDHTDVPEYAGLASALAVAIARTSSAPAAEAEAAGLAWGHELAQNRAASADAPRKSIVRMLGDLGFAPQQGDTDPREVALTRCPLLQAAYRYPEVVCAVHLGLVRGALTHLGGDPAGTSLVPFARPGACLLVVSE